MRWARLAAVVVLCTGTALIAAVSASYESSPQVQDAGGSPYAYSTSYDGAGSIGGVAIDVGGQEAQSTGYSHAAGYLAFGEEAARLTLSAAAHNPPDGTVAPGMTDIVMLHLQLAASQQDDVDVLSVTLTADGTGNDAQAVTGVRLYQDVDGDGQVTAADVLLGSSTYSADDGTLTVTFSPPLRIAKGQSCLLLVLYDLTGNLPLINQGDTFRCGVAKDTDVVAQAAGGGNVVVSGAPVYGGTMTVSAIGSLAAAAGSHNPGPQRILIGGVDIPMLQVRLSAGPVEDVALGDITLQASGSGDDGVDVLNVRVWLDADADGKVGPNDQMLAGGVFTADDGDLTLSINQVVPAGGDMTLLVTYSLSAACPEGATFSVSLTDVVATGMWSGKTVTVSGLPVDGATMTASTSVCRGKPKPVGHFGCFLTSGPCPPADFFGGFLLPLLIVVFFAARRRVARFAIYLGKGVGALLMLLVMLGCTTIRTQQVAPVIPAGTSGTMGTVSTSRQRWTVRTGGYFPAVRTETAYTGGPACGVSWQPFRGKPWEASVDLAYTVSSCERTDTGSARTISILLLLRTGRTFDLMQWRRASLAFFAGTGVGLEGARTHVAWQGGRENTTRFDCAPLLDASILLSLAEQRRSSVAWNIRAGVLTFPGSRNVVATIYIAFGIKF